MGVIETEVRRPGRGDRRVQIEEGRGRPIRVAFVLHAMHVAGVEVLVLETIRRLAGRIEPTVICLDAIGRLGEQLHAEGVEVICLERKPGRDPRTAWRMARVIRRRSVEVLHAHQYTPFFYAALARLLVVRSPRLIFTEHGRRYPDSVSPLRRIANRFLFDRLATEVNGVCGFSALSLSRVDGFSDSRIEVIENGIEVDRYGPPTDRASVRRCLGLDPARRYIANVARFHPVKDQETLVRGFAVVAAAREDVHLLLVGDGPLRGELEALVERLGLAGRVHFLGVRTDVPEILSVADVFALTSRSEAASLTLMEAMATGLAVVVTNVGGNPELVRDGLEGVLVPRGDAKATAAALLRLLDDPAEAAALGSAGRARARERYRLDRTIEEYMNIYSRLAHPGRVETLIGDRREPGK